MNAAELAILLAEGEGTTLEYKEGLSASFARELVALANTVGGRILLGVRDDGSVAGVDDSNELRARILGTRWGPSRDQVLILRECSAERTLAELLQLAGRTSRTKFRYQAIRPLLEAGWLAMMVPGKPSSSKQRYRTTAQGLQVLSAAPRTSTAQAPHKLQASPAHVRAMLEAARQPRTRAELQSVAGVGHRQHFVQEYLSPLLIAGWLVPTVPDKPRSPRQRYRRTPLGQLELSRLRKQKS